MKELKTTLPFPPDLDYKIVYDTTPFIAESINEVFKALRDAIILVAIVVLAFLQSWRATLIPLIAVPVAIVGTFGLFDGAIADRRSGWLKIGSCRRWICRWLRAMCICGGCHWRDRPVTDRA